MAVHQVTRTAVIIEPDGLHGLSFHLSCLRLRIIALCGQNFIRMGIRVGPLKPQHTQESLGMICLFIFFKKIFRELHT